MDSLDFWICSLRSIANGSLILIILPRCFNHHSASEPDSKEYPNSKFRYTHNEVNLLSRWTYSWILPLLWHGYKTPIDVEVLEKVTEKEKSKNQAEKLKEIISVDGKIDSCENLFRACLKMNWYVVLMGGLYRLAADICSLASALSIKWIVKSINDENKNQGNQTEPASENNDSELVVNNFWTSPYVIVFAIFAFSVLQGIFSQATSHFSILAGIRAKNAILVLLYEKTLTLPVIKEQKQNTPTKNSDDNSDEEHNESNIDIGHVTNLATEDISNVKEILWNFHYSWALPLKIIVIGILIHARIGLAGSLSTAVGVLCIIPLQLVVGKLMSDNNKKIQEHSDRRILLSSEVIQGMKSVKLGCLEELKLNQISQVRKKELICLKKDSWLWSAMTFLASVSTLLVSVLVISFYALLESEPFKSEDIFTTLALLNQLTVCLSVLPVTLPIYVKGFLSLRRLKTFWRQNQQTGNGNTATLRENNVNKDEAIVMKNATFSWPNQTEPSASHLKVEQLCIKKGTLTMVLGQKSPFFLSLLKEMKLQEGGIFEWNMGEDIAFVGQRPWIINGSIKENILMGRPFKEKRYKKVLIACDLEADINILPLRDGTEVGEDGVLLSGHSIYFRTVSS